MKKKKLFKKIISVILVFVVIIWSLSREVLAGSQGPNSAAATGDCVNATGIGTVAWTNPGNAFSTNDTYATAAVDGTITNYIKCTNFGFTIPSNAVIKGIVVGVERKANSTGNGGSADAAMRIVKGGVIGATDRSTATVYTTVDTYEDHGGTTDLWGETLAPSDINATTFGAAIASTKASGAGAGHTVSVDHIRITVHYTVPPNAPTQDSPLNNATGVSVTPTFTMTATDSDSDNIGYKVTIYSNSACTTVVQTNDQAVSSTGWTGTNATCTAAPTSCYTSGTQGSFLTQTALSASTQYWWKASAKDPDGTGTFTDSSTCNTFTTEALQSTFTQNDFEWFEDQASVTLTSAWGNPDLAENTDITVVPVGNNPPGVGEKIRLQVNITVGTTDLSAGGQAFKLQFKAGTDQSCSTGSWTDVGAIGATTVSWRFFDNTSLTDGATEVNQISTSEVAADYVESNPTQTNPNAVTQGQDMEWDFAVESVSGQVSDATTYAFRVVKSDGTAISYTAGDCPTVETEPGTSNLLRHGNVFVDGSEKGFFWAD